MTVVRTKLSVAVLFMLAFASICSAQIQQTDVYFASEIWTGADEPIRDAAMLVVDGRIVAVGPRAEMKIPAVANTHDLGASSIIPGLVAVQTGLSGAAGEAKTLTPEIRAIDGFDFFADRDALLKSGITTVQVSPPNTRLMPGVGGVVQLDGEDLIARILSEEESLSIVLSASSRNPPRIYEPPVGPVSEDRPLLATKPQLSKLSPALAGLRQILRQAKETNANDSYVSPEDYDDIIQSVADMMQRDISVRITAQTAAEIRGAVELAKEFELQIVLDDCRGLEPFAAQFDSWKPYVRGVILAGETPGAISNPNANDSQESPWQYARELMDAGIPVAIRTRRDADLSQMSFVAGQFMQDDLATNELLSAVTSTPAKLMNVEDEVGSLAKGKRADFVVLTGQPFGLHTRVHATYVGGVAKYERKLAAATTVVQADRVYLGDGQYVDDASVVVKGATVRGIGANVSSPADADVKNFAGGVIVPGFIDMGTGLGLGGALRGNITLQTKLGDQLYADDPAIEFARQRGITTALLAQAGSAQATPVVAFKLGADTRVVADPIAIRFRLNGDPVTGTTTNERLLRAGKTYADSWTKYEKDFAEYETKLKEWEAEQGKDDDKKEDEKKEDDKKEADKKEADKKDEKEKEKADDDKKKEAEDKKEEKKDEKEKPESKDKPKEKAPADPLTGTWEGTLDSERLPAQARTFQFELELDGDKVSGSVTILRSAADISEGSFDRDSRALVMKISRRGAEVEIKGTVNEEGQFSGTINLGRLGEIEMTATRTVDKSKKPESEEDEKEKPEKKDKPEDKKDSEDDKEKPKDSDKKDESDKKDDEKSDDKKSDDDKKEEPAKADKPKEPRKPRANAALEPYRALFAGKIPAIVESRDLNSIKATAELFAKKYELRTIILGADDLSRQPNLLDDYSVSVCVGPNFSVTVDNEQTNLPQLLANEQLPFGFQSAGTTGSGKLPAAIQFSVSKGLSTSDALDGLATNPAKMLSEELSFGQLALGKDADLVVLSGPPFEHSTKILAVMIDGVWVYEHEEQK